MVRIPEEVDGTVKDLQSGETAPLWQGRFLAKAVPANGYKTFALTIGCRRRSRRLRHPPRPWKRHFIDVTFDLQRGAIASLVEKASGRELVDKTSPYALGQFLHERFSSTNVKPSSPPIAGIKAVGKGRFRQGRHARPRKVAVRRDHASRLDARRRPRRSGRHGQACRRRHPGPGQALSRWSSLFRGTRPASKWNGAWTTRRPIRFPKAAGSAFPLPSRNRSSRWAASARRSIRPRTSFPERIVISAPSRRASPLPAQTRQAWHFAPWIRPWSASIGPGLWKWSMDFVPKRPSVFINLYNNHVEHEFPLLAGGLLERAGEVLAVVQGRQPG